MLPPIVLPLKTPTILVRAQAGGGVLGWRGGGSFFESGRGANARRRWVGSGGGGGGAMWPGRVFLGGAAIPYKKPFQGEIDREGLIVKPLGFLNKILDSGNCLGGGGGVPALSVDFLDPGI